MKRPRLLSSRPIDKMQFTKCAVFTALMIFAFQSARYGWSEMIDRSGVDWLTAIVAYLFAAGAIILALDLTREPQLGTKTQWERDRHHLVSQIDAFANRIEELEHEKEELGRDSSSHNADPQPLAANLAQVGWLEAAHQTKRSTQALTYIAHLRNLVKQKAPHLVREADQLYEEHMGGS